jgi:Ion channel
MDQLLWGLVLMAASVLLHLGAGLALLMRVWRGVAASGSQSMASALSALVLLFAGLILLHLVQVLLWGGLYAWGIGWDFATAAYFSIVTYATIGYGDVVPPPDWRLVAAIEGLTGVLLLGCSSAMVFALLSRLFSTRLRAGAAAPRGDAGEP